MNRVNRKSKVPLYYQLYEILRAHIIDGEWQIGDMLPTETEMVEKYKVSRNTVRQALDALVSDGKIIRYRGRGTFVAQPSIEQGLNRIISFTEDIRERGFAPQTDVLSSRLIPASETIAKVLDVPVGEELAHLERLRLADKEPMSIELSYLVHQHCPGVLNQNYAQVPLREELERSFGIRLVHAKQTIRAVSASEEMATKLHITPGAALLFMERISFSEESVPIEFLRIYHRGDRYALHHELRDDSF